MPLGLGPLQTDVSLFQLSWKLMKWQERLNDRHIFFSGNWCSVHSDILYVPSITRNINPLNAEINSICNLLVLLGAHPILYISRIKVKKYQTLSKNDGPLHWRETSSLGWLNVAAFAKVTAYKLVFVSMWEGDNYNRVTIRWRWPDSVVAIATGYGLGGPGIESRWGRDFLHLSRPTLGPTQPPV
jgi:hypothetical protein